MVSASTLLKKEEFDSFRLIAGESGLKNEVTFAAVFDWEEGEDILTSFFKGGFVLTTLSMYRDNLKDAEKNMKHMINNHIAALAIKDVFFKDLSKEFKKYADEKNVAVFIFSDKYKNVEDEERLLERYAFCLKSLNDLFNSIKNNDFVSTSLVPYKRGFFVILMHKTDDLCGFEKIISSFEDKIWEDLGLRDYHIGISKIDRYSEIDSILKETIYANTSCILDNQVMKPSSQLGIDKIIFSTINKESNDYVDEILTKIKEVGTQTTPYLETILLYAKHNGNIIEVANELYQHKNTIRYRIGRIKKIFGDNKEMSMKANIYYFTRGYYAREYLKSLI